MKKEQMVGSRLPVELVQDLEMIERVEQTDRSTALRKLLHKAVRDWKREYYARQYGDGRMTLARAAGDANVSLWEMMDYVRQRKIAIQYDLDDLRKDMATALHKAGSNPAAESER
jgi:predicted HTH domain antitoxin